MTIHPVAARGFHGEVYEQGRPTYPNEAIDALLHGVAPGGVVVDLGAGTGKLTRSLDGRVRTVAIDPLVDMLGVLERELPDVPAIAGTAEAMPVADRSAGAIMCGSVFHWLDLDAALPEIHRVLLPSGRLGLVWNRRNLDVGWVARVWGRFVDPYRSAVPGHDSLAWREGLEASELFGDIREQTFTNEQPCNVETLIARIDSTSFMNTLENKAELFDEIRDFCNTDADIAGRDAFPLPYKAYVYTCEAV